jgi:acetyltransferase-like isoleucine patch superfamily enzyme
MKARSAGYTAYMVLSIMLSLSIAAIPAILMFGFFLLHFTNFLNSLGFPFANLYDMAKPVLTGTFDPIVVNYFWVFVLFVPVGLTCYAVFLGFLLGMFKLSRRGIPFLEDGYYEAESENWLLYEYFEVYYVLFPFFAGFFSVFLDTKPRHQAFGAKIGASTVVGNGRLFNPERTIIGDNCFFGYDAILSGHVYEGRRLYLKTVKLGNNVTVGANAVILPGADIGDNVIIGANTVVPKDTTIPSNTIWVHGKAIPRIPKGEAEVLHQPVGGPSALTNEDAADTPENGERL